MMPPAFSSSRSAAAFVLLLALLLALPLFIKDNTRLEKAAPVAVGQALRLHEASLIYFTSLVHLPRHLLEWIHSSREAALLNGETGRCIGTIQIGDVAIMDCRSPRRHTPRRSGEHRII